MNECSKICDLLPRSLKSDANASQRHIDTKNTIVNGNPAEEVIHTDVS